MGWVHIVSALCAFQLSSSYLLPGDVTPSRYDVTLLYDIEPSSNFSAYGVVEILIKAIKPTSKILLHLQDLTLNEPQTTLAGDDAPIIRSISLNDTYNLLTLELDRPLTKNAEYTLTLPFYGNLKPGLDGVYISTYNNKDTRSKEYLVATQFEAISARKGFPCFDEPLYKASFRITIGHQKSFTAVSNMPLETTTIDNAMEAHWPWSTIRQTFKRDQSEYVFDRFENSVPMSTYLVAFVISKFKYVESQPELSKAMFKIWARSDAIDQTAYAANIGPRVLTHFEEWFNVSFPLPKQDMIAIPDFSAGAMENWGLITYRETALLYDKQQSSFLNKERVAEVIAHELAHQWFGNLVTMKWWSDLWLNEGFATFAASVGVAAVEPQWRADRSYAVDNVMSVLALDALESSHPVSAPIDDPKRISEIFDEISYRKGSTLIRMMTMFLGDKVFKEAIHNYLVKYSYSNAEQDDLWAELTAVSRKYNSLSRNVTVKHIMDTWTTQTGYPILDVERDYGSKSLTVTQKRYLALGAKAMTSSSWWVPLSVMCEDEARPYTEAPLQWLAADEGLQSRQQFEHGASNDQWVLFNPDMIALYRVNYDERNWRLLSATLASERYSAVPVLGRVQLLSDAFELAWTNRLNYTIALELASYLQRESEYLPLETGLRALAKIENVIKRSPDYGAFQKYVRKLVGGAYMQAGGLYTKKVLNGDDLNSVKMQVMTSSWACRMKVPGCEENAIELYQRWMEEADPDENNPIPIDLRRTVYCVAISRGSVREWRFALARRQRANVAAVRDMLLMGLACTREVWILNQYLEWSITEGTEVRRQDAASVIVGVLRSTVGYYVGRDFIYTRIQDIYAAFNNQGRRLGYIIKSLLDQFTKQEELDEFLVWQSANEKYLSEATLAVAQAVERARVNIAWLARNGRAVVGQLRDRTADAWDDDDDDVRRRRNSSHKIFITKTSCLIYLFLHII